MRRLILWVAGVSFLSGQPYIQTAIPSDGAGGGNISVRIYIPSAPRYPDGAPVVVPVQAWTHAAGYPSASPDLLALGALVIYYLQPGASDPLGAYSETDILHSDLQGNPGNSPNSRTCGTWTVRHHRTEGGHNPSPSLRQLPHPAPAQPAAGALLPPGEGISLASGD